MSDKDGFSFSRMHKLYEEKKRKEESRVVPLPTMDKAALLRNAQAIKPAMFPHTKFPTGEKRTTLRISIETADKARELENKIYWLTKKRLSLAQQARIALNIFLEIPLELEDITEDDDLEQMITQKALSWIENAREC